MIAPKRLREQLFSQIKNLEVNYGRINISGNVGKVAVCGCRKDGNLSFQRRHDEIEIRVESRFCRVGLPWPFSGWPKNLLSGKKSGRMVRVPKHRHP